MTATSDAKRTLAAAFDAHLLAIDDPVATIDDATLADAMGDAELAALRAVRDRLASSYDAHSVARTGLAAGVGHAVAIVEGMIDDATMPTPPTTHQEPTT